MPRKTLCPRPTRAKWNRLSSKLEAIFVCLECGAKRPYGIDGDPEYDPLIGCDHWCKGSETFNVPTPTRHAFVGIKSGDIWVRTLSTVSARTAGEKSQTQM